MGYMSQLDLMIILYLIFWGPSILFHSDGTNLQSHLQWTKIPFYPHPFQDLLSFCFFNGSYSNRCGVAPYCGFHFHSRLVSDVECLFTYLLSIWLSSLEKTVYSGPLFTQYGFICHLDCLFAIELHQFFTNFGY